MLVKRAGYKAFCAGGDMRGLLLMLLMPQTLTWYLGGRCKETVACRCSAKKLSQEISKNLPATLLKRDTSTGVFQSFLQNFSEKLFYRSP